MVTFQSSQPALLLGFERIGRMERREAGANTRFSTLRAFFDEARPQRRLAELFTQGLSRGPRIVGLGHPLDDDDVAVDMARAQWGDVLVGR